MYSTFGLTPWLLPEMNGAVLRAILGVIWLLEDRVHITCILFLAIIYKSICQKCKNFLDILHIYSQHKFLQLSAICNNRKTKNRPLSNYAYRYNRFQHNNDCLNSSAKHNYRNDDCQIQEIWAKLTRRAKAYSISSSVVIVSKIAYHLDSAHRDPNTHRP